MGEGRRAALERCYGMGTLFWKGEVVPGCRSRVGTQKPSGMQKSGRHADAVQARKLRVPSMPGAFVRMEAAGEFGSRPQRPFPGAVRGFLPESGGKAIRPETVSVAALRLFSGQGKHEGQRFSGRLAPGRRMAPLCEEKSPKGSSRKAFLYSRLKRELWRASFVLR